MPAGIARLKNLAYLGGFPVSRSNLEDLSSLSKLKWVGMYKLENASRRVQAARAAPLKAKRHLTSLELHWTVGADADTSCYGRREDHIKRTIEVIEELCPPSCLKKLIIEGYFGDEYSSWMMEKFAIASILPQLELMKLRNCVLCSQLPPLATFPQLDCIQIEGASAVKTIGPELFGRKDECDCTCRSSYFPKLQYLSFVDMPNWEEWSWLSNENDEESLLLLPSPLDLTLKKCPKLRSLPEGLLRNAIALTNLWIKGAHSLTRIQNLLHLQELSLTDCPRLKKILNLPSLKELKVDDCNELKKVRGLDALQYISLWDSKTGSLPDWFFTSSLSSSPSTTTEHDEVLVLSPAVGDPWESGATIEMCYGRPRLAQDQPHPSFRCPPLIQESKILYPIHKVLFLLHHQLA